MKIGILTRRAGYNMGSSLQAYAMSKLVGSSGDQCDIIDYDEYSGHPRWKIRLFVEDIEWRIVRQMPTLKDSARYKYLLARSQQYKRFEQFENDYLPLTEERYRNRKQLRELSEKYDAFVCGSDQIWSPLLFDPVYFFNFLPVDKRKTRTVAYAPSLGISDASLVSRKQVELMKTVGHISCREQQGAEIIHKLTGRSIPVVLDPTLMIDSGDWDRMAKPVDGMKCTDKYILCYFLGTDVRQEYVDELSRQLDCKVVNIQMFNRLNGLSADTHLSDVGPCEFLWLVKNAQWVCTDSFHATIFSYLFHKDISVFERFKSTEKANQNSRIYTLLEILEIQDSLVHGNCAVNVDKKVGTHTDSTNLNEWRARSLDYLYHSLHEQ